MYLRKVFNYYLFLSGILAHTLLIYFLFFKPIVFSKVTTKLSNTYYEWQKSQAFDELTNGKKTSVAAEINSSLKNWQAKEPTKTLLSSFEVNGVAYHNLKSALTSLKAGDELFISEGTYQEPLIIKEDDITITGVGHVVFQNGTAEGKGLILAKGDNLTVNNIECKGISVRDGNGACVRLEGINLVLNNVYFHNSQQGVLETAKEAGLISIENSRFERLGYAGQAHGLYANKASVQMNQSVFIAAKDEGHALKVRGQRLTINKSIIASFSSDDSRLIDMPNGGVLRIKNTLLAQGPNSVNGQMIGYGLEGIRHKKNSILLENNLILLERLGVNYLLSLRNNGKGIAIFQEKNLVVGKDESSLSDSNNHYFDNRKELNIPVYPMLPKDFFEGVWECPIVGK